MWVKIIFYGFALLSVMGALSVVMARNPVNAAVSLVFTFVAMSPLWIMTGAEFLGLVLVFVYVGAVMTLFLFVVMMLNLERYPRQKSFVSYMPFATILVAVLVGFMLYIINPAHFALSTSEVIQSQAANFSNVKQIGATLYTFNAYPLELAAVILLVAIVAAIALAFRGPRSRKVQDPALQVEVKASDRVTLIDMPAEKS